MIPTYVETIAQVHLFTASTLLTLKIGIFRLRSSVEESACIGEMGLSNGLLDRESFIAL